MTSLRNPKRPSIVSKEPNVLRKTAKELMPPLRKSSPLSRTKSKGRKKKINLASRQTSTRVPDIAIMVLSAQPKTHANSSTVNM